jgi:hypothetical protein
MEKEESKNVSSFAETVMTSVELLTTTGKSYRRKIYKVDDILYYFIDNMKLKFSNMGDKYIIEMIKNINNIFNNVSRQSNYDMLEFVYLVIEYGYKMISYKFTKKKLEPKLPDYTMAEIKDLAFSKT